MRIDNGGVVMGENGMTFGKFVREHREALGKSLRSVAAEIEMAPAYLSAESGEELRKHLL